MLTIEQLNELSTIQLCRASSCYVQDAKRILSVAQLAVDACTLISMSHGYHAFEICW